MSGIDETPPLRSVLLAHPKDAGALDRAFSAEADAIAFDLQAGAPTNAAAAFARSGAPVLLIADATDPEATRTALRSLRPSRPFSVLLKRAESPADLERLGATLAVEEARAGFEDGACQIVIVAETGGALFGLNDFKAAGQRLQALAWDGEALSGDLGSEDARDRGGRWLDPCQTARTLVLAAAADARLPAIDSPFSGADPNAFRREAEAARRDGFSAKFVLDGSQAMVVNAVFSKQR